jgi:hypothetical protein
MAAGCGNDKACGREPTPTNRYDEIGMVRRLGFGASA